MICTGSVYFTYSSYTQKDINKIYKAVTGKRANRNIKLYNYYGASPNKVYCIDGSGKVHTANAHI